MAGGFLTGKFTRDATSDTSARRVSLDFPPVNRDRAYDIIDVVLAVAARHGVSAARVALAWVLAQPGVTSTIVGAKRVEQLTDNIAAVELELTERDLSELDSISALAPEYTTWIQLYNAEKRRPRS